MGFPDQGDLPPASVEQPSSVYELIICVCISILMYSGAVLEILCFILFVSKICKKVPYFKTAYFYMLLVGYFVDVFAIVARVFTLFARNQTILNMVSNSAGFYSTLFLGPWNTLLALNRFTALIFWKNHDKIWSRMPFAILLGSALAYPFIEIFYAFQNPKCFFHRQIDPCMSAKKTYEKFEMYSNGAHIIISAVLSFVTALSRRLKLIQISADKRKFETHLLIQSFFSSILFGFYCILGFLVELFVDHKDDFNITDTVLLDSFQTISSCYTIYFHISSTLLLFFLSKTVRDNFIQFYHLHRIFKCNYDSSKTAVTECGGSENRKQRSWLKKFSRQRSSVTVF